jgi:hypothetical protein
VNNAIAFFLGRDMDTKAKTKSLTEKNITVEDVNRLLDLGRLLFSVLTPDEIEELQTFFSSQKELGNTGDS